ncbi:MAG: SIS domain-containing protein [Anaerolineae bacterium]|nr:SIS domain-containing protein [Anaerolineae bacterium]
MELAEAVVRGAVAGYREEVYRALQTVPEARILEAIRALQQAHRCEGRVFVVASPADERVGQHLSEELAYGTAAGAFRFRPVPLESSLGPMAAWQSDWVYDDACTGRMRGLVARGDVILALSRRGQEPGLVRALEAARRAGAMTIALVGFDGGMLADAADICLHVRSSSLDQIEDVQTILVHSLCHGLRALLAAEAASSAAPQQAAPATP